VVVPSALSRLLVVLACALALAPVASAATTTTVPVTTPAAPAPSATLTRTRVLATFEAYPKVKSWLQRYPKHGIVDQETYDGSSATWTVKLWYGKAGEIAQGTVDDASGAVTEAFTGPQVAWGMARGGPGAFGGTKINSPWLWGTFCVIFLVGLADFRRLRSIRNLDLLLLLSPTASLWFFNHGHIFASATLFYPALVWVVARGIWIGATGRGSTARPLWPAWLLLAATVFLAGFRIGLNTQSSNVIDVGYSGVIGAERIVHEGEAPWGNFPVEDDLKPCGPANSSGEIRERIQTNGRCESANPLGDTYGPVAYEAYIPGYLAAGWSGKWDSLPASHITAIAWDLLCMIGLWLVGRRFGGLQLAAMLAFAWAAYPFTQYASMSNTNDAIMPCLLIFGFWLISSPVGRGAFAALSGLTKFASFVVAPLWLTYPNRRPSLRFTVSFAVAALAALSVVLLEPSPLHELRVFWHRTVVFQIGRSAPFSLWDWRQYHAKGLPNLHAIQRVLQGLLVVGALAAAFWPRVKSPLQLAALTAALLAGFEMVMTYWLYTYIPWFYAFAAIALLAPAVVRAKPLQLESQELDPERAAVV
jgi:hypothetical protein